MHKHSAQIEKVCKIEHECLISIQIHTTHTENTHTHISVISADNMSEDRMKIHVGMVEIDTIKSWKQMHKTI